MSKIYTSPNNSNTPKIDYESTKNFFKKRASKIETLGSVQAVIYQDHNSELAKKRNLEEKNKILPLLNLNKTMKILDVGCGTGRWADILIPECGHYYGIDSCDEFIQYSLNKFKDSQNARFSISSAHSFTLKSLDQEKPFDRVLCAGVLIYLNDKEVYETLNCMANALTDNGLLLLREPMGINQRLTILDHYSDEMNQNYSAIYRTPDEIVKNVYQTSLKNVLQLIDHGDVYDEKNLNNRLDTKQKWLLFKKSRVPKNSVGQIK